jgi:hypothetical protein
MISATSISSSPLAIPYRHHGIISQILTSTLLLTIPSLNTLTIDNWSAPNNLWELSKKNINVVFAEKAKLKTQTVIQHITHQDPEEILQKENTASTVVCLTITRLIAVGSVPPNAEHAVDSVMKAPTVVTSANRTTIEIMNITRNRELINQT